MNQRVNIYGFPHKWLRNALGKLSFNLGKLDVSSEEQIQEIKLLSNEVSELLKLHLHSEEKHVLVPLKEKDPKIADHNHEDHLKMERLEDQMMFSIHQLIDSPDIGIAIKSYQETNLFIREYFRHMDEEENEINEIIWSHFSDEEILEWQGKILSELTPDQFFSWFKYIIPALHPLEQSIMLGGFKQNAPDEVYQGTIHGLKPFITEQQFEYISNI